MKGGNEARRNVQFVVLSVIMLAIVTLSVSYSAIFSVRSVSTLQEINTGDLNVAIYVDNTNSIMTNNDMYPRTFMEVSQIEENYSTVTLLNEGSLDADFSVTLTYDYDALRSVSGFSNYTDEELRNYLISFNYLNLGIYDVTNGEWISFSNGTNTITNPKVSDLTPVTNDNYSFPILRDSVEANVNGTEQYQREFKVYVWLDNDTPSTEIGKYVYIKLNVKCAAGEETITETVSRG